jgi:hypothetical protein
MDKQQAGKTQDSIPFRLERDNVLIEALQRYM